MDTKEGDSMRKHLTLMALAIVLLTLIGCANSTKPVTLPPGAISEFDAKSYESLMGAQAVLESVKADLSKLPPEAKPALNKAIASYNIAERTWQKFHAGTITDPQELTVAIAQAVSDVAILLTQSTGGK